MAKQEKFFLDDISPDDTVGGAIAFIKEFDRRNPGELENSDNYRELMEEIVNSKKNPKIELKEFAANELRTRLKNKPSEGTSQSLKV